MARVYASLVRLGTAALILAGLAIAALWLGERPASVVYLGALLAVGGVVVLSIQPRGAGRTRATGGAGDVWGACRPGNA